MKKLISLLFLALVLGLTQVAFAQDGARVQLRTGQQKWVANGRVKIKFISVMEDSRCPVDVDCIWAGNAKVKVQVWVRGGETRVFELNTNNGAKGGQADAYRITLESLTPAKKSNINIRQRDYRATFSVRRLSR